VDSRFGGNDGKKSMQSKTKLKIPLLVGSIIGITFYSIVIFSLTFDLLAQNSYAESVSYIEPLSFPEQVSVGLPIRLKIPKIKVDAAIEYVGLNSKGEMGIPKTPRNTAWYNLGPRPGEVGSAAIAGHLNWYSGATGVFANLSKLRIGDKIIVQDDQGATSIFIVRKIRLYGTKEDASEVFVSNDGRAHLNLITCDGVWDKKTRQYSKRLVVFADKV
jgi:LPXTG-site transpeptidase (sortase) family protein